MGTADFDRTCMCEIAYSDIENDVRVTLPGLNKGKIDF
jgi:hypothetical protein